jgi:hypothetical protein
MFSTSTNEHIHDYSVINYKVVSEGLFRFGVE